MERLVSFSEKKEHIIRTKNQHNHKHDFHILVTTRTVT